jgi:hypothetical protein
MDRHAAPDVQDLFTDEKGGRPTIGPALTFDTCMAVDNDGDPAVGTGEVQTGRNEVGTRFNVESQWEPNIWKETMNSFQVRGQMVATALIAFGMGMAVVPTASADPDQPPPPSPFPWMLPPPAPDAAAAPAAQPDAAAIPGNSLGPTGAPQGTDPTAAPLQSSGNPTKDACDLFNKAVNYAAINYEDFADYSAGSGNYVDYASPTVDNANLAGRTALKQAAAASLSASGIPGAAPEVTNGMRMWSLNAAKMVVVMGVRGGGDALNSTATDMNLEAHETQVACARAQQNS